MTQNRLTLFECAMDCPGILTFLVPCSGENCELACGGEPVKALQPKGKAEEGKEKHVPVIEKIDGGYRVKVGDTPHPMKPEHYIQFIELKAGNDVYYHFFEPGDDPVAEFRTDATSVEAREYCNVHGLWSA